MLINHLRKKILNCQTLHAQFDYIRLLIDKFMQKDPLQAICYSIPGYHMISTGHYASNHGGLVIYLNNNNYNNNNNNNTLFQTIVHMDNTNK